MLQVMKGTNALNDIFEALLNRVQERMQAQPMDPSL